MGSPDTSNIYLILLGRKRLEKAERSVTNAPRGESFTRGKLIRGMTRSFPRSISQSELDRDELHCMGLTQSAQNLNPINCLLPPLVDSFCASPAKSPQTKPPNSRCGTGRITMFSQQISQKRRENAFLLGIHSNATRVECNGSLIYGPTSHSEAYSFFFLGAS